MLNTRSTGSSNFGSFRLARQLLFALVVIGVGLGLSVTAQAHNLGVAGGLNFTSASDIQVGNREATLDQATGFHFGAYLDLPLGPVSIRPGVRYVKAGPLYAGLGEQGSERFEFDVSYLVFPADVRLNLPVPILSPYVFAGPELHVQEVPEAPEAVADALVGTQLAGNIGLGAMLNVPGANLTVVPELRVTRGPPR